MLGEVREQKLGVRVLVISIQPVERGRNRTGGGDGIDKRASNEFGGRIGSIK
jgi:hypothetical protein